MKPGDFLWVDSHGTHLAVVIEILTNGSLFVICGTGTQRTNYTSVCVQPQAPAGKAAGLYKPTYFYASGVAIITSAAIKSVVGKRCPPNVFHALEELARSAAP